MYMLRNGIYPISVSAGRPICSRCGRIIQGAGSPMGSAGAMGMWRLESVAPDVAGTLAGCAESDLRLVAQRLARVAVGEVAVNGVPVESGLAALDEGRFGDETVGRKRSRGSSTNSTRWRGTCRVESTPGSQSRASTSLHSVEARRHGAVVRA